MGGNKETCFLFHVKLEFSSSGTGARCLPPREAPPATRRSRLSPSSPPSTNLNAPITNTSSIKPHTHKKLLMYERVYWVLCVFKLFDSNTTYVSYIHMTYKRRPRYLLSPYTAFYCDSDLDTRRHDPAHFVRDLHLLRRRQGLQERRQGSRPGDPLRPLALGDLSRRRSPCRAF